jgi:tetratricopeptide (TPR) repeat protein
MAREFQDAQQAFDGAVSAADFLRSAALYQEILDSGFVSGAVLYNQGNAYMRAGERGRAIAAYRQSERFRPRDPYLRANLRYALGGAGAVQPRNSVLDYILFWQEWISYTETFYLLFIAAVVTLGSGLVPLLAPKLPAFKWLALVSLVVTIVLAGSAAYNWYRFEYVEHGVLVRDDVIARKGNADSYATAFQNPLPEGTEFQVVEHRGDWLLIRLRGSQEGWVKRDTAVLF